MVSYIGKFKSCEPWRRVASDMSCAVPNPNPTRASRSAAAPAAAPTTAPAAAVTDMPMATAPPKAPVVDEDSDGSEAEAGSDEAAGTLSEATILRLMA